MSAALRPQIAFSPLPELRKVVENRLAQSLEIAVNERLEPRPDWNAIAILTGEQRAFRAILNDLDRMEHRT